MVKILLSVFLYNYINILRHVHRKSNNTKKKIHFLYFGHKLVCIYYIYISSNTVHINAFLYVLYPQSLIQQESRVYCKLGNTELGIQLYIWVVFYRVVSQKQNLNVRINTVGIECTQRWLIVCCTSFILIVSLQKTVWV